MPVYRPRYVPQLDGSRYEGLNCTCAVGAMALDRETLGKDRTTGARVRQLTGDTTGGTNQQQVVAALHRGWSVDLTTAINITTTKALQQLDAGKGMGLAGAESATRGTKYQASETFGGNHQWWVNERRRNAQVAGDWEWLVMDPLGDARRPGIADFTHGLWLPQTLCLEFARRLNVSSDPLHHNVPLGLGHLYAFFTHDTEPHLVLRYSATAVVPHQQKIIAVPAGHKANVRSAPRVSDNVTARISNGDPFNVWQVTKKGQMLAGSSTWYGSIDGTRWLHSTAF